MSTGQGAAIILAAGLSSRSDGFKPLLPLGEGTIVDRVISIFQRNDVEVYLVVGYRQSEVKAAAGHRHVNIIENPDYAEGMFTSVKAGMRALHPGHEYFFVMPVDIPLVRQATIARLISEAGQYPDRIIYPVFGGRRGHPPLIPVSLVPDILGWNAGGGLKAALSGGGTSAREVTVPDENILFDVDTRDDYRELLERFARNHIPTDAECVTILDEICRVAPDIRQHSLKVADIALLISRALNDSGHRTDIDAVRAAAMLHDIAKGQPEHDAVGGRILESMGFGSIGGIVAVHTDLPGRDADIPLESKIIFLADKFVDGTALVSIEARYRAANDRFATSPEIEANIATRKARALAVKHELELQVGYPLEKLILK